MGEMPMQGDWEVRSWSSVSPPSSMSQVGPTSGMPLGHFRVSFVCVWDGFRGRSGGQFLKMFEDVCSAEAPNELVQGPHHHQGGAQANPMRFSSFRNQLGSSAIRSSASGESSGFHLEIGETVFPHVMLQWRF